MTFVFNSLHTHQTPHPLTGSLFSIVPPTSLSSLFDPSPPIHQAQRAYGCLHGVKLRYANEQWHWHNFMAGSSQTIELASEWLFRPLAKCYLTQRQMSEDALQWTVSLKGQMGKRETPGGSLKNHHWPKILIPHTIHTQKNAPTTVT